MKGLIVIPAYNCEKQVARVLSKFEKALKNVFSGWDVLVVDNRSADSTLETAVRKGAHAGTTRLLVARNVENYGLGGSQKVGFTYALEHGYSHVVILHGDDQGEFSDLLTWLSNTDLEGIDAGLGSRFMKGSTLKGYSLFRTLGNKAFNTLFSASLQRSVTDLGSGLNIYRTEIFRDGFHLKFADDLTFNYFMLLAHAYHRHNFAFFPIHWTELDQVSNVKLASQSRRLAAILLSYLSDSKAFMHQEHRQIARTNYATEIIYSGYLC